MEAQGRPGSCNSACPSQTTAGRLGLARIRAAPSLPSDSATWRQGAAITLRVLRWWDSESEGGVARPSPSLGLLG